jgi:N-acetylglucosamine-6-phosphate deacetylase
MKFAQWDLQNAVRIATLNPARVVRLNNGSGNSLNQVGSLKPGGRADILVLSPAGEVRRTIIGGAGI